MADATPSLAGEQRNKSLSKEKKLRKVPGAESMKSYRRLNLLVSFLLCVAVKLASTR